MFARRRILITVTLETLEGLEGEIDRIADDLRERIPFEVDRLASHSTDTEVVAPTTVEVIE